MKALREAGPVAADALAEAEVEDADAEAGPLMEGGAGVLSGKTPRWIIRCRVARRSAAGPP